MRLKEGWTDKWTTAAGPLIGRVPMDVYLAVNSSDWKGRKADVLKIRKAETGCVPHATWSERILRADWSVGKQYTIKVSFL